MAEKAGDRPFDALGAQLKQLRNKVNETLGDVSADVEVDEKHLKRIEDGFERPSEDILTLLINHFNLPEEAALDLWDLADYEDELPIPELLDDTGDSPR